MYIHLRAGEQSAVAKHALGIAAGRGTPAGRWRAGFDAASLSTRRRRIAATNGHSMEARLEQRKDEDQPLCRVSHLL